MILPLSASSFAGDTVPQNGQTSACLAGFHTASAPQAGHENFSCAVISDRGDGVFMAASEAAQERAQAACRASSGTNDFLLRDGAVDAPTVQRMK